eukprot:m.94961 g.94961  ORF g.94961 m.94961 type:complete len:608 (+) comp12423_c0_seq10:90-1913(+)
MRFHFSVCCIAFALSLMVVCSEGQLCKTPQVPMVADPMLCQDFCEELAMDPPDENSVCDAHAFYAQLKNTNGTTYIYNCIDLAHDMGNPLTVEDLGLCGMIVNNLNETLSNEFAPTCDGPVSRCPRGPSATRDDIDEDFYASLQSTDKSFIRSYVGSGGVPNAFTMSFGLLEPRETAKTHLVKGVAAIPVYIDLTFTAPQDIDSQRGLVESTILIDEYYDQSLAEALYGYPIQENTNADCDCFYESPLLGGNCECELDEWTVNTVFDNLKQREILLQSTDAYVDCGSGWCSDVMPEGFYYKRSSYFQGSFKQNFDLSRFPFDSQEFWVNFTLQVPYGYVTAESIDSRYYINTAIGGFFFEYVDCHHKEDANQTWGGYCKFFGERVSGPSVLNLIIPSLLFVLIAFSSLAISVKKSMPRVAMTMFALLVVTQQRSQIIASLPPSQDFVWIDMYLFCCIIVIVLIMFSHAISERWAEQEKNVNQVILDKVLLGILPLILCVFVIIVTLAAAGISQAAWISVGVVLLCMVIMFGIAWYIRSIYNALKDAEQKDGKARKWSSLGSVLRKKPSEPTIPRKDSIELTSYSDAVQEMEKDEEEGDDSKNIVGKV